MTSILFNLWIFMFAVTLNCYLTYQHHHQRIFNTHFGSLIQQFLTSRRKPIFRFTTKLYRQHDSYCNARLFHTEQGHDVPESKRKKTNPNKNSKKSATLNDTNAINRPRQRSISTNQEANQGQQQKQQESEYSQTDSTQPKFTLTVVSYNIDGLRSNTDTAAEFSGLVDCVEYILDEILEQRAHIALLQEVTLALLPVVNNALQHHFHLPSHIPNQNYFTLTYVAKTMSIVSTERIPFNDIQSEAYSIMGRDLLLTTLQIPHTHIAQSTATTSGRFSVNTGMDSSCYSIPVTSTLANTASNATSTTITVINTHAESSPDRSASRVAQLSESFSILAQATNFALLAGDLNLRAREATKLQKQYPTITDAFDATNAKKRGVLAHTWLLPPTAERFYALKASFDRVYYCSADSIKAVRYEVIGTSPLARTATSIRAKSNNHRNSWSYDTPSDHYGIVVQFAVPSYC